MQVTLPELYRGATRSLEISRKVIDRENCAETCMVCKGQGVRYQATPMGRIRTPCEMCGGQGQLFVQTEVHERLDIHIPMGAPVGHKINFYGKADEIPGAEAGDVVVVLLEDPHMDFTRRGEMHPCTRA